MPLSCGTKYFNFGLSLLGSHLFLLIEFLFVEALQLLLLVLYIYSLFEEVVLSNLQLNIIADLSCFGGLCFLGDIINLSTTSHSKIDSKK